jgi:predicted dehydrogenase
MPAVAENNSLRLAAIVDTPERIADLKATSSLTVPMYDDVVAGLSAVEPELAIVATPHDSHVPLALCLLQAGIPTLLEKPPARNADELARLIQTSRDYNTPLAIVLPLRYKIQYQRFAQILRSPRLTDAAVDIDADVPCFPGIGSWRWSRERAGGGVLIDLGYHYLELLVACLGQPDVSSVQLHVETALHNDVEDKASVSLWFDSRRLKVNIRLRSGSALIKRSDLVVTKNGQITYASSDGIESQYTNAQWPSHSVGVSGNTATAAQLRSLLDTGFLTGCGGWHKGLAGQLYVMHLLDSLYAAAGHIADIPERTFA